MPSFDFRVWTIRLISLKSVETQFLRPLRRNPAPLGVGGYPRKLVEISRNLRKFSGNGYSCARMKNIDFFRRPAGAPENSVLAGGVELRMHDYERSILDHITLRIAGMRRILKSLSLSNAMERL